MEKIELIRDNRKIGEILLLCSFYYEEYDSNYLIYAKEGDLLPDSSNIVYFGKLLIKDGYDYLVSINNEDELSCVKAKIRELFKYSQDLEKQKRENNDINKIVKIPDNLFSTIYDVEHINREKKNSDKYEEVEKVEDNREYRSRLKDIYDNLNMLKPIDKISTTLYVNYYNEMGMILKSKLVTLSQLWTEYQLLYNEKQRELEHNEKIREQDEEIDNELEVEEENVDKEIEEVEAEKDSKDDIVKVVSDNELSSDFDELFNSLSQRIESLNDYLDELRELKDDIKKNEESDDNDFDDDILVERKRLERDKRAFEEYRKQEKEKLSNKKEELQVHFNKFQTLVENFDKKIKEVK